MLQSTLVLGKLDHFRLSLSSGAGDWRSRPEEDWSLRVPLQHEATYVRVARAGGAADHDGVVVVVRGGCGCVATRLLVDEHGAPRKGYAVRILWVEQMERRERFNYLLHITSVILQSSTNKNQKQI